MKKHVLIIIGIILLLFLIWSVTPHEYEQIEYLPVSKYGLIFLGIFIFIIVIIIKTPKERRVRFRNTIYANVAEETYKRDFSFPIWLLKIEIVIFILFLFYSGITYYFEKESYILTFGKNTSDFNVKVKAVGFEPKYLIITNWKYDKRENNHISIPDNINRIPVREIGNTAFGYAKKIESLVLSENLILIDDDAFCYNYIVNLTIPNNIQYIGNNAFANNKIENLYLPDKDIDITYNAFANNNISILNIPESVNRISGAFYGNDIEKLVLSSYIKNIERGTFNTTVLNEIVIGDNVIISNDVFEQDFINIYNKNMKKSGKYVKKNNRWRYNNTHSDNIDDNEIYWSVDDFKRR